VRVLVTDGDNRASLAITRSLGRRGHAVFVAERVHPSLAGVSRYCTDTITYSDPATRPQEFVEDLAEAVRAREIEVLIPVSDITTLSVAQHRHSAFSSCKVPFPDFPFIEHAASKARLLNQAESLGVPTPISLVLEHPADLDKLSLPFPFPVVIKPDRSRVPTDYGWLSTSVSYANSLDALRRDIYERDPREFPLLLQERIHGPGIGVFMCCLEGTPVAVFSHRRLREKPPSGGVSVLRESIAVNPSARSYAARLLADLHWTGVAMVEFKLDQRDKIPKLMEINGRFWGSLQLAIDAGIDFPSLLLDILQDQSPPPVLEPRLGVKSRWFWGDVDSLLMVLLKSHDSLGLPPDHPGRIRTLLDFLVLWGKDLNYEVLSRKDIRPWLLETRRWLAHLVGPSQ
jgi:predicted ATP-grasp superfamily ATP-dependent carboligase